MEKETPNVPPSRPGQKLSPACLILSFHLLPPPTNSDQARWFSQEVQPHEPVLRSYLRTAFPTIRDVDDVVQESYLRIWKRTATRRITSAQAFLFRGARNLALDVIRHESASPLVPMGSLAALSVPDNRADVVEVLTREEKAKLLGQAFATLPARCREILFLHKIKGLSQRAIAERFGLSEKTVANQVGLGVNRCEEFFRLRGIEFF